MPVWPLPEPYTEFVRWFGLVKRRRRRTNTIWSDEAFYCSANRALKFLDFEKQNLGSLTAPYCVFRRLFCDGLAVVRVEAGIADERVLGLSGDDCVATVASFLDLPTKVTQAYEKPSVSPLYKQGASLAKLYLHASAKLVGFSSSMPNTGLICPGRPMVLFEYDSREVRSLPKRARIVQQHKGGEGALSFAWIFHKGQEFGIWFIEHEARKGKSLRQLLSAVRQRRLSLLRLHAEQQVIKNVLRQLVIGTIEFRPHSPAGDALQEYLRKAMKILSRDHWQGFSQKTIIETFNAHEDLVGKEERVILLEQLQQARRQIFNKIKSYTQIRELARPKLHFVNTGTVQIAEKIIRGGDNVTVTTVKIGDGNTFHGDVIAAGKIQNSFNKAVESDISEETRNAVKELTIVVGKLCEHLESSEAQTVSRDLETFVNEATAEKTRANWLKITGEGLIEAAKTVAIMAEPVATAVKAVFNVFGI
jgi:hypothetical protein